MSYVTRDGVSLWYDTHGSGRPLVLLHGFTLDSRMWSMPSTQPAPCELLALEFQVICIDARGHGKSDTPPSGYARHERVADIVPILDHLELAKVDLIGFSMGGGLSIPLAIDYPERVHTMTLVATGAAGWPLGKKLHHLFQTAATLGLSATKDQWIDWSVSYYRKKGRTDIVDAIVAMIDNHTGAQFVDSGRGSHTKVVPDLERVHSLRVPVLIQIGSDDRIFVPLADALHEKISESLFSLFEDCGHLITMEEPVRWVNELHSFLDLHPLATSRQTAASS